MALKLSQFSNNIPIISLQYDKNLTFSWKNTTWNVNDFHNVVLYIILFACKNYYIANKTKDL